MKMLSNDDDADAEVTWEDQERINTFSKLNTYLRDIEELLEKYNSEKEALDDLTMELELADESEPVLYKIADTYAHIPLSRAQSLLTRSLAELEKEIDGLKEKKGETEGKMKDLKVLLYAKFGSSINLD